MAAGEDAGRVVDFDSELASLQLLPELGSHSFLDGEALEFAKRMDGYEEEASRHVEILMDHRGRKERKGCRPCQEGLCMTCLSGRRRTTAMLGWAGQDA